MKHYRFLDKEKQNELFYKKPMNFDNSTVRDFLQYALGSLLYMPADKKDISNMVIDKKYLAVTSICLCLEDAIKDTNLEFAETNIINQLKEIYTAINDGLLVSDDIPLIFVRVRSPEQLQKMLLLLKSIPTERTIFTGFILPKFNSLIAINYLEEINNYNKEENHFIYAMPILESSKIMHKENRIEELLILKTILFNKRYFDFILNIRVGATDFSSLYGLRRNIDSTIYDISVIRDVLVDIINVFARSENKFVISGPVWEFFNSNHEHRVLKPSLRETPFTTKGDTRKNLLGQAIDGLIKEVSLDKINGFCGKTTIHPTHITFINAIQIVTEEEYKDALNILNATSGVFAGINNNKMNEVKPHTSWARTILLKAEVFGVLKNGANFAELY